MHTRRLILGLAALAAGAIGIAGALPGAALAQSYPSQPVTVVVPFPPGGGTDTVARIAFNKLDEMWDQPIVIRNQPGASGMVGTLAAMREDADGYTLIMASTGAILSLAREGIGMEDDGFRVESVLTPITQLSADPYVVAVHPSLEVDSIEELIAYAADNPDTIPFGSSGVGSASHLTGVLFEQMAGVDLRHVPYSGMGNAGPALLGGDIQVLFAPPSVVLPHVEDGTLRALAVTSLARSPLHPDIPTIHESGLEGFSAVGWFGLYAPEDMDEELRDTINAAVREALDDPAVVEALANQGAAPAGGPADEYRDWVNNDIAMWLELVAIAEAEEN
jgi:tripartite-type tricarboxylate transporter receptor subunit TctC